MKRTGILTVIIIVVLFLECNANVYAGWAQVNAVLRADQKTVSSEYALFDAKEMFCCTQPVSRYPIKFQAYGTSDFGRNPVVEANIIYNVGQSGTEKVNPSRNYHKIVLTGWNINAAVKDCIGYGYITD